MYTTKQWEDAKPCSITFMHIHYHGGRVFEVEGFANYVKRIVDKGVARKEVQKKFLRWDQYGKAYIGELGGRCRQYDIPLPKQQ